MSFDLNYGFMLKALLSFLEYKSQDSQSWDIESPLKYIHSNRACGWEFAMFSILKLVLNLPLLLQTNSKVIIYSQ